jgi:hypothetical protein
MKKTGSKKSRDTVPLKPRSESGLFQSLEFSHYIKLGTQEKEREM